MVWRVKTKSFKKHKELDMNSSDRYHEGKSQNIASFCCRCFDSFRTPVFYPKVICVDSCVPDESHVFPGHVFYLQQEIPHPSMYSNQDIKFLY